MDKISIPKKNLRKEAIRLAGVSESTFYNAMKRLERGEDLTRDSEIEVMYQYKLLQQARAEKLRLINQ